MHVPELQSLPSSHAAPMAHVGAQAGVQVMLTLVTSAPLMVPKTFEIEHDCVGALGSVFTATSHIDPSGCAGKT